MTAALVGLGSNVGDRRQTLDQAVERIKAHSAIAVLAHSDWRTTAPIGGPAGQAEFLNGVLLLETPLSAPELLALLHSVENAAGRERTVAWGPRTLDLDLLLFGAAVIETAELTVPHPRMTFRRFVVDPAAEIAPDWVHPTLRWPLSRLRGHLHDATPYIALAGPGSPQKSQLAKTAAAAVGGVYLADPAGAVLSSGPSLSAEIQFQKLRTQQLSRANWPYGATPAISDYWIEEPAETMPCKLLVICDQQWSGETPPAPLLQIPDTSSTSALSELTAAIQAMESRS